AAWCAEIARVADVAWSTYHDLVYDDRRFATMFAQCTPIDVLGELNIGSRPVARGNRRGLASLRAIPWVFAWMQTRIGLPSWYGAGAGLAAGDLDTQREMYERWPFFNNV